MFNTTWKSFERKVAKDFGTSRVLQKGKSIEDVTIPLTPRVSVLIDCKARESLTVESALNLMYKYGRESDIRVIIYRKNKSKTIQVYLSLNDLCRLCCSITTNFGSMVVIPTIVSITYAQFRTIVTFIKDYLKEKEEDKSEDVK